jgi:transposase
MHFVCCSSHPTGNFKARRAVKREAGQKILSLKLQKYTSSCLDFFRAREAAHLSPIIHVGAEPRRFSSMFRE